MYLRTIQRRNKDGSVVRYVQLAHNVRHPESGNPVAEVIHSFGREDMLDREALGRLVRSITRYLGPEAEPHGLSTGEGLAFVSSKRMGGAWALDVLWRRVGIDKIITGALVGSRKDPEVERVLFALVANRALEPLSKLAATRWVAERAWVPGLDEVSDDACYRAMDLLLAIEAEVAEQVYWSVADLLNLEVDLLFFDTTSTYFEIEAPDAPGEGETVGLRAHGHSKDHRGDLPQVVIGLAVTREGIPIRVWCWPGNTNDSALIRQVKDDLRAWRLGRVVWVGDRGFSSAENRRYLQRGGGHYIVGEKLRSDAKEAQAALARKGRYREVAANLRVKEVVVDDATMRDRFVVCHNPEEAARDEAVRDELLAQLGRAIASSDKLSRPGRDRLAGELRSHPGYRRFLRTTGSGLLRIDRAAVAREAHLDGKFLLRTSDPTLSAEDVALGYKQLLEVERAWRDMKSTLELRPVHHRLQDRIRAHVELCWLALLLIRLAEQATGDTWRNLRNELDRMHVGEFAGNAGRVLQRTAITARQRAILKALGVVEPKQFLDIATEPVATGA
ncbi:MAG: IS1634 family transposase [Actinomycetota bacterium]